jgi:5-carboxymethyl-2-hydroxymuconate isomerase
MPHIVIEHGNALDCPGDAEVALRLAFDCGAASGFIRPEDIKVRTHAAGQFLHGDGRESFVHMTVLMLQGRTDAQKAALAEALREAFAGRFPAVASISVDIRDMNTAAYRKRLA